MTEASKERKRDAMEPPIARARLNADRAMPGFLRKVIEHESPVRVITTGISCRMGVGGRRARKRRRAEARTETWVQSMHRAGEQMTRGFLRGLTPAARAPTAAARSR